MTKEREARLMWNTIDAVRGSIPLTTWTEEVVAEIGSSLAPEVWAGFVSEANAWLYDRKSEKQEYWKNRAEEKVLKEKEPEAFARRRQAWMARVVSAAWTVVPRVVEKWVALAERGEPPEFWVGVEQRRMAGGYGAENVEARVVAEKAMKAIAVPAPKRKARKRA